ncbi:MAG: ATP-binding protein [Acidobacteriota bacterium]|nr:ATP-binding protein [Acidobacteriota bacterium]
MPRSLFLKIFLWFAVVLTTLIVGTYVVGELRRPERSEAQLRRPFDPIFSVYAREAAETYEGGGQTALAAFLDRIQREQNIRAFLYNSQLQELSGRRPPPEAPEVAQRASQTRLPQFGSDHGPPLLAQPFLSPAGGQYVLVAEMPPRMPPGLFHPFMHVLIIVFVGGLFCYGLARYLTSPVTKLRAATKELARGNLSARVTPSLGNRRDELASLGVDFDQMAEQIEILVNSQRRLLGDISHELRSPLARLTVALELARQRAGADATSALERIQREAENLNEMIGQLLALTRLEARTNGVEKAQFDLAELVQQVADDGEFEARSRNRSVRVKDIESCAITGNYELLRRAIENVVRNAVHYTAEGTEVEVELRLNDAEAGQDNALITVRDHGAGVPDAALTEIFRPFYRVDEARDREAGGVGLGLAIAERAIRIHGGTIEATNASEGGLVVTIMLPLSKQQTT